MQSIKGRGGSGSVRAETERMACLQLLRLEWIFGFSSRSSERAPQVA